MLVRYRNGQDGADRYSGGAFTAGSVAGFRLFAALQSLIEQNGRHLETLGVSHAALEIVRVKTANAPYNLKSKLTGAGGGGCAVTLIPDSEPYAYVKCDGC